MAFRNSQELKASLEVSINKNVYGDDDGDGCGFL